MPNHIQNRLKFIGDSKRIEEIMQAIGDGEQRINFDKIIPCPDVIKQVGNIDMSIETAVKKKYGAPLGDNGMLAALEKLSRDRVTLRPDQQTDFEKSCRAYEETGFAYWYDWNNGHWGTKWNAYEQDDERNNYNTIYFQTAWSCPLPIINKLAQLFPDVLIEFAYADEDSGCNTGKIICKDGDVHICKLENESIKAYELYFELHPGNQDKYVLTESGYSYKEENG